MKKWDGDGKKGSDHLFIREGDLTDQRGKKA